MLFMIFLTFYIGIKNTNLYLLRLRERGERFGLSENNHRTTQAVQAGALTGQSLRKKYSSELKIDFLHLWYL